MANAHIYTTVTGEDTNETIAASTVTFPYLKKSHLEIRISGAGDELATFKTNLTAGITKLVYGTDYTVGDDGLITFIVAGTFANGSVYQVQVKRNSDISARYVDFADGSVVTEANLDDAQKQQIYLTQEIDDEKMDLNEDGTIVSDITGNLTGNVTGNVTGNLTGNSAGVHTGAVNGDVTGDVTGDLTGNADTVTTNANLTGGVTSVGNAATVITNANLTGEVTSVGNAAVIADDMVDEANLKVNNSPTDGYILAALASASGGLTWSSAGAGSVTSVTAGAGMTQTGTASIDPTLNVIGGDGITANENEIEVSVDDTTIELSAASGSGTVQAKTAAVAEDETALATGDQIFDFVAPTTTTANAALPKAGGTMTGNIVMSGAETVDGRDLSSDGTKLDNIEANADVTDAANVTAAGALMDSECTNLAAVKAFTGEAAADVTDTANVTAAGALMDSELTDLVGVKGVTISTLQVKPSEGAFANGDKTKLDGIAANANNYSLPEATSTAKGGVELFSDTVQSVAAESVSTTDNRTYGLQLNSAGQAVVNVPWSGDTYTAGDGLALDGQEFNTDLATDPGLKLTAADGSGELALDLNSLSLDSTVSSTGWSEGDQIAVIDSATTDDPTKKAFLPAEIGIACSDETTAITPAEVKATIMVPRKMKVTEIKVSLTTADSASGGLGVTVQDHGNSPANSGTDMLASEINTSDGYYETSTAFAGGWDQVLDANHFVKVTVSALGNGEAKGLKVWLLGYWA